MSHIFKGKIYGRLCDGCIEKLPNVKIRLYRLRENQDETLLATDEPKNNFKILTQKEIEAKEEYLLAQKTTDENGGFDFNLNEIKGYDGESFEIDVLVEKAPGQEKRPDNLDPVQFTADVYKPHAKGREDEKKSAWEYYVPYRYWCRIREKLGGYVICGRVLDCETENPIPNVEVFAFDRDWIQDDALGSATTNGNGHFLIYYSASDFKKGTVWDVELVGGPDLYFSVETSLGTPLLSEDPSRGRKPDRENAGACFCVTLCLSKDKIPPPPEPQPAFTHIGSYDYENDIDSLNPPSSGLTKAQNRAFFRNLRLNGSLAKKRNGNQLEYRFETCEVDSSGNPIGGSYNWQPVKESQLGKLKIGVLQKPNPAYPGPSSNPIKNVDYVIKPNQPDEIPVSIITDNGIDWIQVPQEDDHPLDTTGDGYFTPNHNLAALNTRILAPFNDIDLSGLVTGDSSTSTGKPLAENKHFAIRMIVREKGNSSTETVTGICEHIAVNNTLYDGIDSHPAWYSNVRNNQLAVAMVDISQLQGSNGCSGITDQLDVLYTAAHPNLGTVNISMKGPGGPYGFTNFPAAPTTGDHSGTATPDFNVADLQPCAYIVNMSVQILLTDGDHTPSNLHDEIGFCKNAV
ncbi:carboxypeptidase-like regulatory domain-containing protein [Fodinibius halophilus]|uniref:Carboxypeptidase regulatory-like domain-containing protein n=1 Tax=Fodinibius halophilus TaxID=1736908 RepID=A0A6M1T1L2_9BACT|nr:carboxypeptidase-like regulatory domain-containing protein [Fodinibius halophilus]NGP89958.1 carboxypeptidase regulatory-like domain-containing protein [Fodinibius halophilus]